MPTSRPALAGHASVMTSGRRCGSQRRGERTGSSRMQSRPNAARAVNSHHESETGIGQIAVSRFRSWAKKWCLEINDTLTHDTISTAAFAGAVSSGCGQRAGPPLCSIDARVRGKSPNPVSSSGVSRAVHGPEPISGSSPPSCARRRISGSSWMFLRVCARCHLCAMKLRHTAVADIVV